MWEESSIGTLSDLMDFRQLTSGMNINLEGVMEGAGIRLLWDFNIQTASYLQARRQDLVVIIIDRKRGNCFIIDITVPRDFRVGKKKREKVDKYQDLGRELAKLWNIITTVVPIVVGALGLVTDNLTKHLKTIRVSTKIELLQKTQALLGIAFLLRNVLKA